MILCLVLVQPRKTRPDMTEKLFTGMKESKTNEKSNLFATIRACSRFYINFLNLTYVFDAQKNHLIEMHLLNTHTTYVSVEKYEN